MYCRDGFKSAQVLAIGELCADVWRQSAGVQLTNFDKFYGKEEGGTRISCAAYLNNSSPRASWLHCVEIMTPLKYNEKVIESIPSLYSKIVQGHATKCHRSTTDLSTLRNNRHTETGYLRIQSLSRPFS